MNRQLCGSAVLALGILIVCARCAFGLNPSLDVNQYARTSWKINEGFSKGVIWSIAQTPDGYLWLGTEFGLLRFDGVRTVPWEPPIGERLPSSDVRSLRAARDGRLWIGTVSGLVSWKDGKISRYPQLDGQIIEALLEDRDHTMWVIAGSALSKARLCRIQNDKTECYENSGIGVTTIYEDSKGNLWAGAMNGVWRWTPGPPKLYPMPGPAQRTYALIESEDGGILIARRDGISKMTNGRFETYAPTSGLEFPPDRLLRDRDGGLWVGALTEHGLLHIHHGRTDLFTPTDGLSGDTVTCVFEDREGNVWVSTTDGLDRFRDFAIPPISKEQGLSSRSVSALVAAKDGGLWLGTSDGLTLWNKEEVTIYRGRRPRTRNSILSGSATNPLPHSAVTVREIYNSGLRSETLFEDQDKIWVGTLGGVGVVKSDRFSAVPALPPGNPFSITGDRAGNVWISHDDALFHLHRDRLVERIPWANFGHNEPARALLYDAVQRGLWTGFRDGGVAFFKDGQVRASFTSAQGLGEGRIHGFYSDAHGAIWVATQGGLSRIEQGRVLTLTSQNGLGCNTVNWMIEDDAGSVWLYMACGLVRIARSELDAWASQAKQTVETTVFDSFDGVRSQSFIGGYGPRVAKSTDGRLWFVGSDDVRIIDPHHLAFNKLPPPVHIEQIIADGKTYDAAQGLCLPPNIRDLEVDYTALSLTAPEKMQFRIKLEGQDSDWRMPVNPRHAHYTNLRPNTYRLRVIASNDSGVWNEQGATLDFVVLPAWYQTTWFRVLSVVAFLALVWGLYQLRTRQLQRDFRKLRDMIETIPAMAWTALPDGSNEFENRRWAEYIGFSDKDAARADWSAAAHPEDRDNYREKWRAALASGEPFECEARFRSAANGEYRWFFARAVPLRNKYGKILRWYGILADIEERKQQRDRVRQLESDLAHINRVSMMGELAASIAHEVNQPLSGIVSNGSACLRWMASGAPDMQEIREAIDDMVRDGKRAGAVIARIRALTKRAVLPSEKLDINETLTEVLSLVRDETQKRGVAVTTNFASDLPPVSGDRVQLQQVTLNLIMNAMEAMNGVEESRRRIVITTQKLDDNQVVIDVEDSGTGLDPNAAKKIFEPFYTTKSGGMGMGLSISRSIVESHGGRLWATANDGPGTTFHFTLPQHQQERMHA